MIKIFNKRNINCIVGTQQHIATSMSTDLLVLKFKTNLRLQLTPCNKKDDHNNFLSLYTKDLHEGVVKVAERFVRREINKIVES